MNIEDDDVVDIKELIAQNRASNKKVRESIKDFNNYNELIKQWNEYTDGPKGKQMRRSRHDWDCPVCKQTMNYYTHPDDPSHPTLDHKHPKLLAKHLVFDENNLWVICRHCNQEKKGYSWAAYEYFIEYTYGKDSHQYRSVIANRLKKNV
ncbi:MAG: HNH endonuclease signature motif containing protein [Cyanobacteriota bacterium ELA615]|jgi:5-methylcytosine-specific restriction endonuclease McrA